MKDRGHGGLMDRILRSLKRFGLKPDFESIYMILECLTDPKQGIRNTGPFAAFLCKSLRQVPAHPEFEEVLLDFRRIIYNACTIHTGIVEKNRELYDKLFRITEGQKEVRRLFASKSYGGLRDVDVPIGNTIVTTNYDMSIELYHRLTRVSLADGFEITPEYFVKELDLESYLKLGDLSRWLIKLHGSIWQFKQGDRIIKTIEDPEKSSVSIKVDEEIMIYPIGEKPILTHPYYSFYRIFKEQPWDTMIAIGYSFRDEPVNIAIIENLEKNYNACLIVLNPESELVISNLGGIEEKFRERIIPIPEEFGSEPGFQKLSVAVESENRSDYEEKMKEKEESWEKEGARCPKCGTIVIAPSKKWKMAGRPDQKGKRMQLTIALFDCPKCKKSFRKVLSKKKI